MCQNAYSGITQVMKNLRLHMPLGTDHELGKNHKARSHEVGAHLEKPEHRGFAAVY